MQKNPENPLPDYLRGELTDDEERANDDRIGTCG
jgi:anti-sigma factor RsiW